MKIYGNRVAEMGLKCSCGALCEWGTWYRNTGNAYNYRCTACLVKEIERMQGDPDMQPIIIKHADEAWPKDA